MTARVLAGEYLGVKGGMWSSKSMLRIIRSKALASSAVSTTDSDYPSTSNSSPKGVCCHLFCVAGSTYDSCMQLETQDAQQGMV